ncbi:hypothetical protein FGW37_32770 [Streptomyces rectiverticillatus]|uniref:hypothetical protein n=1 Tax=Streptomyces rectiverticillatus TaxID=173860 RepID=UPI0015C37E4E|nr:hypothetical protein [Streptomyces rectiverticillatus]QLE75727.1 hypothetical protein FGW37_32770 [Streptomyces rectiverticillatus]
MISSHRPPPGHVLAGIGIGVGLLMVAASAAPAAAVLASPAPPAPAAPARSPMIGQAVGVACNAFGPTLFVRVPSQLSSLPSAAAPELTGFPECLHGMNPPGG